MPDLNNRVEKLKYVLDLSWRVFFERLLSGKISINLESSMQLHYSSIIHSVGEALLVNPSEIFSIELEHKPANTSKYIDIQCSYNDTIAAVELKCFRKGSNRAKDMDMYDALKDIHRLQSLNDFKIKKFICLTDDISYVDGLHTGHAGKVTIKDGRVIEKDFVVIPSWIGKWKDKSRDVELSFTSEIQFNWIRKEPWYCLIVDL